MSSRPVARALTLAVTAVLAVATACTTNLLTPIPGLEGDAAASDALAEASTDGAAPRDAAKDTYVPQLVGDGTVQEGGAGSVDSSQVVPFGGDGAFHFIDVPFFCGGVSCDPVSHYCLHILPEGGLTPEGGGDLSDQCLRLPAACGGHPSCSCVVGSAPCDAGVEGEGCVESAGVEVSCPTY